MTAPHLQLSSERWRTLDSRVSTRDQVIAMFREAGLPNMAQEVFMVIPMKDDLSTPGPIEVARGTYRRVEVSLAAIMGAILTTGCDRFVVAHNHPHSNPQPSLTDAELVTSLAYASDMLDLTMEDAYIFAATGEVYSFAKPRLRAVR